LEDRAFFFQLPQSLSQLPRVIFVTNSFLSGLSTCPAVSGCSLQRCVFNTALADFTFAAWARNAWALPPVRLEVKMTEFLQRLSKLTALEENHHHPTSPLVLH
jgi:hypothetical protein